MSIRIIPDVVSDQTIYSMRASDTAQEAAELMLKHEVSAILVIEGDNMLEGIVTERDMTRRVVALNRNASAIKLSEIMTHDPETLSADDTAFEALERMLLLTIRHLPVVEDGRVIGIVSMRNLRQSIAAYTSRLEM